MSIQHLIGEVSMNLKLLGGSCGLLVSLVLSPLQAEGAAGAGSCGDRGSESYSPAAGPLFNDPTGSPADEYRIISTIERNIDNTRPGDVVRIATLRLEVRSVANALIRAHECGVDVRVVVNEGAWNDPVVVDLRQAIGTQRSRRSYVTRCDGACLFSGPDGIMHAKLYLFSRTGGVPQVTMHSSSNITAGQAEIRFNDAFQTTRNAEIFDAARRYFDKLGRTGDIDYQQVASAPGHRQFFFPQSGNFHRRILDDTRCRSSDGPTSIDFSASIWKSRAVARAVADLHDAGCVVRAVLYQEKADRRVLGILHRRGVPTHVQSLKHGDPGVTHSKYLAIDGEHRGRVVQTVYCGSLNVTEPSRSDSNNNMLRIVDDAGVHRAYTEHFDRLWSTSRTLTVDHVESAHRVNALEAERRD